MTSIYSKSDTTGHTQRPPDAPRQTSKKRRHADQSSVPHEPHPSAAMNFIDQHPVVDGAAAAKSRHREQKALKREAKKATNTRAAPSSMAVASAAAASAAVLVATPQTAMTASASQAAQQIILNTSNSQPNSSRDSCQAVTALPCSVAAPSQDALKMAEVCNDPVHCNAAGTAPGQGCMPSYRPTVQTAACMVANGKCAVMRCEHQLCDAPAISVEGSVHIQCRSVELYVLVDATSNTHFPSGSWLFL